MQLNRCMLVVRGVGGVSLLNKSNHERINKSYMEPDQIITTWMAL